MAAAILLGYLAEANFVGATDCFDLEELVVGGKALVSRRISDICFFHHQGFFSCVDVNFCFGAHEVRTDLVFPSVVAADNFLGH